MNKYTRKCCKKYLNAVRKELCCSFNVKNVFISDIKTDIKDLIEKNPNITMDEIINILGTPQDIASSFHKHNIDVLKKRAKKLLIGQLVLVFLLLVGLLTISFLIYNYSGDIKITDIL